MFKIDRNKMDSMTKLPNAKTDPGKNNVDVFNSYKSAIWNIIDMIGEFATYEMAHWSAFIDRWINNRTVSNEATYKRGEILLVDLGADNFRFEPSFTHPCVVIKNRRNTLYIAPCSSKKFGKGFFDIIDAYGKRDGFSEKTGIQIEAVRWINKNRVISSVGQASPRVLDKINEHMLTLIPSHKKEKKKMENLTIENTQLKDTISSMEEEINKLKDEICVLKSKSE